MVLLGAVDLIVWTWIGKQRGAAGPRRRAVIIGTLGIVSGVVFVIGAEALAAL